jgi:excisionase family DNA binding protein
MVQSSLSLLISLGDTQRLLGVSRSTVYRLIQQGQLAVVKINARHLVTRESLLRLVTPAPQSSEQAFIPHTAQQAQGGQ